METESRLAKTRVTYSYGYYRALQRTRGGGPSRATHRRPPAAATLHTRHTHQIPHPIGSPWACAWHGLGHTSLTPGRTPRPTSLVSPSPNTEQRSRQLHRARLTPARVAGIRISGVRGLLRDAASRHRQTRSISVTHIRMVLVGCHVSGESLYSDAIPDTAYTSQGPATARAESRLQSLHTPRPDRAETRSG